MERSLKITGFDAVLSAIENLPKELSKSVERTALREAMQPVLKMARAKASQIKDTGLLAKSIGISVRKGKSGLTARVGPRTGFKQKVTRTTKENGKRKARTYTETADPVKYAGVVEYGSSKVPARSFIRSSVQACESQILAGLSAGYVKGLSKAADKLRKA